MLVFLRVHRTPTSPQRRGPPLHSIGRLSGTLLSPWRTFGHMVGYIPVSLHSGMNPLFRVVGHRFWARDVLRSGITRFIRCVAAFFTRQLFIDLSSLYRAAVCPLDRCFTIEFVLFSFVDIRYSSLVPDHRGGCAVHRWCGRSPSGSPASYH
ncbi:hypothetical protein C2E23DRAFT_818680 [Lenzites betulinus]|nr:hypothetical protein C2E23DRAFT_818680 [Lenzites betulinus]